MMISITSGKGGVGKTSLVVNLCLALAPEYRILLVDADLGLANVDIMLSLAPRVTLRHILLEGLPMSKAVVYSGYGFDVLPAASGVAELVQPDSDMKEILELGLKSLAEKYDLVFFDTGAGIGHVVLWFNCLAEHIVVVFTPEPTSLTDAYALIKVLYRDYGRQNFLLLANQATEKEGEQYFSHLERVLQHYLGLSPHYLGAIPRDQKLEKSIRQQKPLLVSDPESKAAQALNQIARRLKRLLF